MNTFPKKHRDKWNDIIEAVRNGEVYDEATSDAIIAVNAVMISQRLQLESLHNWREYDWPNTFDSKTADMIVDNTERLRVNWEEQ